MSAELSAALDAAEDVSAEEASFDEAVELVPFELHAVSVTPARAAVSIYDKIFFMSILRFCGFTACQCCILFIFLCSAPLVYGFYLFIYNIGTFVRNGNSVATAL